MKDCGRHHHIPATVSHVVSASSAGRSINCVVKSESNSNQSRTGEQTGRTWGNRIWEHARNPVAPRVPEANDGARRFCGNVMGTSWERCYCTQVTLGELGLSIYTLRGFFFFFGGLWPNCGTHGDGAGPRLGSRICDKYEACEINLEVAMARHVLPWATLFPVEYVVGNCGWDKWLHTSHPCQFPRSLHRMKATLFCKYTHLV